MFLIAPEIYADLLIRETFTSANLKLILIKNKTDQHCYRRRELRNRVEDSSCPHDRNQVTLLKPIGNQRMKNAAEISRQHRQAGHEPVRLDVDAQHVLQVGGSAGTEAYDAPRVGHVGGHEAEERYRGQDLSPRNGKTFLQVHVASKRGLDQILF